MAGKRPLPPTYFNLALILIIGLHFIIPLRQLIDWPYRWIGAIIGGFGAWVTIWSDQLFKRYKTEIEPYKESSTMIVEGPYRFSRNPMYLGMTMILSGVAALLGSLTSFLPVMAFGICMHIIFVPVEEKMMLGVFEEEYRKYSQKVRRWI